MYFQPFSTPLKVKAKSWVLSMALCEGTLSGTLAILP